MAVKNQGPEKVGADPLKVTPQPHQDAMQARTGANTFEGRVVQEIGTH